jgi:isoaspartyl peptidase/L-asparaginase-like protein (Ntn-hydrolase superfamily)
MLGGDAGVIVVDKNGKIAMPWNSDGMKRASVSSISPVFAATFS